MSEALSYKVAIAGSSLEIPAEYVELCGIGQGYSFEIKVGRKGIRLEETDETGVEFYEDNYEKGEDGKTHLRYLTQTNGFDKTHKIPSDYLLMGEMKEGDEFYVRVGRKKIRLLSCNYYNEDGEPLGEED